MTRKQILEVLIELHKSIVENNVTLTDKIYLEMVIKSIKKGDID